MGGFIPLIFFEKTFMKEIKPDAFFKDLLVSRSPTGHEFEATAVIEKHIKPFADSITKDVLGNRFATLGKSGKTLMLAGHIDEIGFIVTYIDDNGFLFFEQLGGHDNVMIAGRRVTVLAKGGAVYGVTGKKAIHLMEANERKEVPETHKIWIDIGANSKAEAEKLVSVGDSVVYDVGLAQISGSKYTARAFDDKAGCYVAFEVLKRISKSKSKLSCKLVSVATVQEEIGTRGAWPASYAVNPDIAIAIDVEHATDYPYSDKHKHGAVKLGAGPVISRGPNMNPILVDRLIEIARLLQIPYQINAESKPTGTDARIMQMSRSGVATGLIGIPLRYMHTPSEVADLNDIENTIKLLEAFALSLKKSDDFTF